MTGEKYRRDLGEAEWRREYLGEFPPPPRPLLLDLYCCAGGAARGYQAAGFDVVGVDVKPQRNYPGPVYVGDAEALLRGSFIRELGKELGRPVAAIHASPECQGYTPMRRAPGALGRPRRVGAVRRLLELTQAATGIPWVMENVPEAAEDMPGAVTVDGSMFGLSAEAGGIRWHLLRRRLLLASFDLPKPPEPSPSWFWRPVAGIYGGHVRCRSAAYGGRRTRDFEGVDKPRLAAELMGLPVGTMTMDEMSEAIPPAYARWAGEHLMREVLRRERKGG